MTTLKLGPTGLVDLLADVLVAARGEEWSVEECDGERLLVDPQGCRWRMVETEPGKGVFERVG